MSAAAASSSASSSSASASSSAAASAAASSSSSSSPGASSGLPALQSVSHAHADTRTDSSGGQIDANVTPMHSRKRPRDDDDAHEEQTQRAHPAQPAAAASPRVHLHRHALESVFACLDIAGLATAMRVSRDWQAAVGSMRSIHSQLVGKTRVMTSRELPQLIASRLRRHVSSITFEYDAGCTLTLATIALLSERMPHLLRLSASDMTVTAGVESIPWPSQLQLLTLKHMFLSVAEANMMLRSISTLTELRRLTLSMKHHAALSFAPLALLPALRVLRVDWTGTIGASVVSDAQLDEFRALSDLDEIDLPVSASELMHLLRPPHALRWQQAPNWIVGADDDAACALFPSLSRLTQLNLRGARCTHFDFLPRVPLLADLTLGLPADHPAADAATRSMMDALQQCHSITSLKLWVYTQSQHITPERLAACLSSMPALSTLEIRHATLPSLSFLSAPSLAVSLQRLSLHFLCDPKPAASELQHLHGLRSLRHLTLHYALTTALDADARAALQLHLPRLESFSHQHPDE